MLRNFFLKEKRPNTKRLGTFCNKTIEIPEAWMPTIRKHNSHSTTKRTREGTSANGNNKDRNTPITANQRA